MLENVKQWKTTLLGVLTAIVAILVATGIINTEQSETISSNLSILIESLVALVTAISSVWLIFKSKDK